jgi:hypothetical protein
VSTHKVAIELPINLDELANLLAKLSEVYPSRGVSTWENPRVFIDSANRLVVVVR